MRICIFADVHANFEALKAVLFDAQSEMLDGYICLGDLIGYGATPNKTIDLIRRIQPNLVLQGNHDRTIVDLQYRNPTRWHRHQKLERFSLIWTHNQITPENLMYLQRLPEGPQWLDEIQAVQFVHGSAFQIDDDILTQMDAKRHLKRSLNWVTFFAHTHIAAIHSTNQRLPLIYPEPDFPYPLSTKNRYLINPGSVGQPRDMDSRASYAIFDYESRTVHIKRIVYNIKAAQDKIRLAKLPKWHADRIASGR